MFGEHGPITNENPRVEVHRQAETALVERAQSDATFRALLKQNPHAALQELLGVDPVPSLKINVVEEQPGEATIVLPAKLDETELPDELLDLASGGIKFSSFVMRIPNSPRAKTK